MTPTMSLLLICGLVVAFTLARLPGRKHLQELNNASKQAAILVHLAICGILGGVVWLFTVSIGKPLTEIWSVLGLLVLESLAVGLLSTFIIFGRFGLHISLTVKNYFQEIKERNNLGADEKEPAEITRLENTHRQLPSGMKVIYSSGKGRWTSHEHDRSLDEEPNSKIS